jgi:hypothetical protein
MENRAWGSYWLTKSTTVVWEGGLLANASSMSGSVSKICEDAAPKKDPQQQGKKILVGRMAE